MSERTPLTDAIFVGPDGALWTKDGPADIEEAGKFYLDVRRLERERDELAEALRAVLVEVEAFASVIKPYAASEALITARAILAKLDA